MRRCQTKRPQVSTTRHAASLRKHLALTQKANALAEQAKTIDRSAVVEVVKDLDDDAAATGKDT